MAFDRYDEQVYMAYIEDDLLPDEAGTFEELLRDVNDPRLGELVASLKQDRQAVISLPHEKAPPRVMQNISKIIEREKQLHPYHEPERAPLPASANEVGATTHQTTSNSSSSVLLYSMIGIAAVILIGVLAVFAYMALMPPEGDPYLENDTRNALEDQRSTLNNERDGIARNDQNTQGPTENPVPMPQPDDSGDTGSESDTRVVEATPPDEVEPAEAWNPDVSVAVSGREENDVKKAVAFWAALNGAEVLDSDGNIVDIGEIEISDPGSSNRNGGSARNASGENGSTVTLGKTTLTVNLRPEQLPGLVQHLNRDSREKARLTIGDTVIEPSSIDLVRNNPRNWRDLLIHYFGEEKAEEFRESDEPISVTLELN